MFFVLMQISPYLLDNFPHLSIHSLLIKYRKTWNKNIIIFISAGEVFTVIFISYNPIVTYTYSPFLVIRERSKIPSAQSFDSNMSTT